MLISVTLPVSSAWLHKFDAALQAQLERYLVSLGILDRGQRLNVEEEPPAAEIGEPALEH